MKVIIAVLVICGCSGAAETAITVGPPAKYSCSEARAAPPAAASTAAKAAAAAAATAAPVEDYDLDSEYSYAYNIQDNLIEDTQSKQETPFGDIVQGSYSVVDPDGVRRVVEYKADPENGFNVVVRREPFGVKTVVRARATILH